MHVLPTAYARWLFFDANVFQIFGIGDFMGLPYSQKDGY